MFITAAYAQSAAPAAGGAGGYGDLLTTLPMWIAIFVIFYFIVLRPQQQRAKQLATMVANVRRGDTVVTAGGLVGKVTKVVDDNEVLVELAEGVRVRVVKATLADVRVKGEPATSDGKSKSDDNSK
ncbi:MAG: preprotein translocase subunit YajC [Alphaproteobacteria bacterium]|nr:preprotein translocase subunit YajC [Alphaproteobacteria bacterium]